MGGPPITQELQCIIIVDKVRKTECQNLNSPLECFFALLQLSGNFLLVMSLIIFILSLKGCGQGYYSEFTGRYTFERTCRICPTGTYTDIDTATSCIQCSPGQTTTGEGSSECQHGENKHIYTTFMHCVWSNT